MKNLGASLDSDSFHFAHPQPSLQCDLLSLQTKLNFHICLYSHLEHPCLKYHLYSTVFLRQGLTVAPNILV